MATTFIINVNNFNESTTSTIYLTTVGCTTINNITLTGGVFVNIPDEIEGYDYAINVLSSSMMVTIDGDCAEDYQVLGVIYQNLEQCSTFTINMNGDCDVPSIPDVIHSCQDGIDILNYDALLTYNMSIGQILSQGTYILTAIEPFTGCYSTVTFDVPQCCPDYIVSATQVCVDANDNNITLVIYNAEGGVADVVINNVVIENTVGTPASNCYLDSMYDIDVENSPSGLTITGVCSGYYILTLNITLNNSCVIQTTVLIDCPCVDCTDNPIPVTGSCCSEKRNWEWDSKFATICLSTWCSFINPEGEIRLPGDISDWSFLSSPDGPWEIYECGTTNPEIPKCGGNYAKQYEEWLVDTTNPLYTGVFSIQFSSGAVPDKFLVYQDGILIAESPAVGFWNPTFCPTDDVLGFWTNTSGDVGSMSNPWIYDIDSNPGVSGLNMWFDNSGNDCSLIEDNSKCSNLELGMKDRRGAGELFFEIESTVSPTIIRFEVWFNPNCTECTQDCTTRCPFCDGWNGSDYVRAMNKPTCYSYHNDVFNPPNEELIALLGSEQINSSFLNELPHFNIDGIKLNDNDATGEIGCVNITQTQFLDCGNNALNNCSPWESVSNPNGYCRDCDPASDSEFPEPITRKSTITWVLRSHNNESCDNNYCAVQYNATTTQCKKENYQIAWNYAYEIFTNNNPYLIIDSPDYDITGLFVKHVTNTGTHYYEIYNESGVYVIYIINNISPNDFFYLFYNSIGLQIIVPQGEFSVFTGLANDEDCSDYFEVELLCPCPHYDESSTTCIGEEIELNIELENCTINDIIFEGFPEGATWDFNEGLNGIIINNITESGNYVVTATYQCESCNGFFLIPFTVEGFECNYNVTINNPSCGASNGSIEIDSIDCPYDYISWTNLSTDAFISFDNLLLDNLSSGVYLLELFNLDNCAASQTFNLQDTGSPDFNVDTIQLQCGVSSSTIQIYNISGGTSPYSLEVKLSGSVLHTYTGITGSTYTTDNYYDTGVYNLNLTDDNGCSVNNMLAITNSPNITHTFYNTNISCTNNGTINVRLFNVSGLYEIYYSNDTENVIDCNDYFVSGVLMATVTSTTEYETYNNVSILVTNPTAGLWDNYMDVTLPIEEADTYFICVKNLTTNCCVCSRALIVTNTNNSYIEPTINNIEVCEDYNEITFNYDCFPLEIQYYVDVSGTPISENEVIFGVQHNFQGNSLIINSGLAPSSYTYYAQCENNNCNSGFDSFVVTVNALPTVTISNPQQICQNVGYYTVTANGADYYEWTVNGLPQLVSGNTLLYPSNIFSTSFINVIGYNENGCSDTASTTVRVFQPPVLTVQPMTICSPSTISTYANMGINVFQNPGSNNYNYAEAISEGYIFEWYNGSVWVTGDPNINVTNEFTEFKIKVTNDNGCISNIAVGLITLGEIDVEITPVLNCDTITLTATEGYTYVWSGTGVTVSNDNDNPLIISGLDYEENYIYSVTATLGSCTATSFINVETGKEPSITIDNIVACKENPGSSYSIPLLGEFDYIIVNSSNDNIVSDINIVGINTLNYNTGTAGSATVNVTAYTYEGCYDTAIFTVQIQEHVINFQNICVGETMQDALISSTIATNILNFINVNNLENCLSVGEYNDIDCCSNGLSIGSFSYNADLVLNAGTYNIYRKIGDCCWTDSFSVYELDVATSMIACHQSTMSADLDLTLTLTPSNGENIDYYIELTNVHVTGISYIHNVTTTNSTYDYTFANLQTGTYTLYLTYLVGGVMCSYTSEIIIDCCPAWNCNFQNMSFGQISTSGNDLIFNLVNQPNNTTTWYIYDVTTTGVNDYVDTGTFNINSGSGTFTLPALVNTDTYYLIIENQYCRHLAIIVYDSTESEITFLSVFANLLFYENSGENCILKLDARMNACFSIEDNEDNELVCSSGFGTLTFEDYIYTNGYIVTVYMDFDCDLDCVWFLPNMESVPPTIFNIVNSDEQLFVKYKVIC